MGAESHGPSPHEQPSLAPRQPFGAALRHEDGLAERGILPAGAGRRTLGHMITDIASYLRYLDSVLRRTERDIAALPSEAVAWRPPPIAGENEWTIGEIVRHLGGSRLYFASAYR